MRRRAALARAGALAAAALAGCTSGGSSGTPTESPNGPVVDVGPDGRFLFAPGTDEPLEVPVGTTVTWIWRSNTHNVVVQRQPEGASWEGHEDIENQGFTYEYTFEVPGEYHYVCTPHASAGMVADVVVVE